MQFATDAADDLCGTDHSLTINWPPEHANARWLHHSPIVGWTLMQLEHRREAWRTLQRPKFSGNMARCKSPTPWIPRLRTQFR